MCLTLISYAVASVRARSGGRRRSAFEQPLLEQPLVEQPLVEQPLVGQPFVGQPDAGRSDGVIPRRLDSIAEGGTDTQSRPARYEDSPGSADRLSATAPAR